MLLGEYQNRIDPRNRVFVPAKFREQIGPEICMTQGDQRFIECYDRKGFEEKLKALEEEDSQLNVRSRKYYFLSTCDTQTTDSQGRITLKGSYLEHLSADKDVVILGVVDHFEIWAKDAYEEMKGKVSERKSIETSNTDLDEEIRILEKETELLEKKQQLLMRRQLIRKQNEMLGNGGEA